MIERGVYNFDFAKGGGSKKKDTEINRNGNKIANRKPERGGSNNNNPLKNGPKPRYR